MGAWGQGSFENDDAMDWVWSLEHDEDGSALRAVLEPVAEYRKVHEPAEVQASRALAAAAVVARARGGSHDALPVEAETWLATYGHVVGDDLVDFARRAVARVLGAIQGEPDSEEWTAEVQRLAVQLG
jgi:hypothetical protein